MDARKLIEALSVAERLKDTPKASILRNPLCVYRVIYKIKELIYGEARIWYYADSTRKGETV